jgi:peptide/nickel transport system ATP-binding protein
MYYKGRDISKLTRHERRNWFFKEIQPVFQDPFATFSPLKRIDSYLYETALNFGMVRKAEVNDYLDEVLQVVGLSLAEIKGRYPSELSGGQAQRISIARALVTRPALIIADEPVSMLDASLRMSIVNLFKTLKEEEHVSALYITHDLATAYYAADRIAIMLRGWIVEEGPVEQVLGNPLHPYTINLKESVPEADPDKVWETKTTLAVSATEEFTLKGCRYAGRCPHVFDRCHEEIPPEYEVQGRTVKCFLYEDEAKESMN